MSVPSWSFEAIGTVWEISSTEPIDAPDRARVAAVIERFEREWSRFRPDSVVSSLVSHGGAVRPAPADAAAMLDLYAELSHATQGAVSPLVGGSLAARGYDRSYSLRDDGPAPAPDWVGVLDWSHGDLRLAVPATIDVGALGKGRLVDLVAAAAAPGDGAALTVDAGGDMLVRGSERVALEHPFDPTRAVGVWQVTDAALCASAIGRRAWPGADGSTLHHVLDARTGQPVRTISATWAVAPTAMIADASATALFFDGGPELVHRWGVEWVRMTTDGRLEWSPRCGADLFTGR